MKQTRLLTVGILLLVLHAQGFSQTNGHYPIRPVAFTSVKVTDNFWGQRLKANREVTIPLAFRKCEETGRYKNFEKAAHPSDTTQFQGLLFDDTDVYKTIEGASYAMQTFPDRKLDRYVDSVIAIVAAAQEPDGYLYTPRTMNPRQRNMRRMGARRWDMEEDGSHELYNLGHLIEAAVAHHQATGKRSLLDVAIRFADCADRELGLGAGQRLKTPGHQIAEMALARLYLATGEKRYLALAKFFLDHRGHDKTTRRTIHKTPMYAQEHLPVTQQEEAVGHAVRATYMYSGMADVAALTGDSSYVKAIDKIWSNIVGKKLYLTGGIGATRPGESFGDNYALPNLTAYCETCAAIGNVYLNHRLFLLHGDGKYYDVLERTLYNGLLSGVSIGGDAFFYPNPLEADGKYAFNADYTRERQPWFGCACCPSNICRFIPSLPGYVYAVRDKSVYVNLFMGNTATLDVDGRKVELRQTTRYPHEGAVRVDVSPRGKQALTLRIRIPGWARDEAAPGGLYTFSDKREAGYRVSLNGHPADGKLENGYFCITRTWRKGDAVEVAFDMSARVVTAKPQVEADRGRIAVERGPLVYCAESADNAFDLQSTLLGARPTFEEVARPELLGGIVELRTKAQSVFYDARGLLQTREVGLQLIPYYAWNHRGVGKMAVWLPQSVNAVTPTRQ